MSEIKTDSVPKSMQNKYDAVVALSDRFCADHLDAEYSAFARRAVAALCRKRPSPLSTGQEKVWACAVIYAIGRANFLDDKASKPYMRMADLCASFEVATSTGGNKAKVVRDVLDIDMFNHNWVLPSRLAGNPIVWMIQVNGFVVDARRMTVEVQQAAVEQGLIPFVVPPGKAAA